VCQTFEEARSSVYGIRAGSSSCSGTTKIHHNYIHDLKHSANAGCRGLFMTSNSHDNLIYNNIIHLVPGLTANTSYCIYLSSGDATNNQIYYNTLYMGGVCNREYPDFYCIKIYKDASDNILKDNILINERTGDVSGNEHCAIYLKTSASFAESNYNLLSVNSEDPTDNRYVARIGSNYYNTLGDLQSAPGYAPRDVNSLTGDPDLSFPDLHLNSNSPCIGQATPIAGITTDIDYDPRDAINPDIGADEFISNHAPIIIYFSPEETAFSIEQNTEQLFSIVAEDPDGDSLFYFWYLDNIQQGENSNEFTYTFSDTGDFVVKALVSDGELADSTLWDVTVTPSGAVDDENNSPVNPILSQNYPNPFSGSTKIFFNLATCLRQTTARQAKSHKSLQIKIYNVKGKLVKQFSISNSIGNNCQSSIKWDGTDMNGNRLPSGIYFYRLKSDNIISEVKKMVLIR
ncbi:MAG: T9SS type A sorting domain-containing protein, partial [Candidatus Cloacimonadota bacterium]|nr:T9SS type A sorting domain-containing protein [Candidatus Cloacimonadota bacterium]